MADTIAVIVLLEVEVLCKRKQPFCILLHDGGPGSEIPTKPCGSHAKWRRMA